jgi:type III pantothenate kinase
VKTICFDFGNSRLKYALFDGDQIIKTGTLTNGDAEEVRAVLGNEKPDRSILSSVIDHDKAIEKVLEELSDFHLLSASSNLNFTCPVGKPETIGADRLALCAAAVKFFPGKHNLVIALGTCITYNFINKYSEFLGGGISPGMDMRFRGLETFTAKLPLISENWNFPLIGYDTATNILSGVILGMAKEIDGFIDAYSARYGNFNVVLTGGNSAYFVPHLKNRIFADPNIIFKGLYAISECNHQPKN